MKVAIKGKPQRVIAVLSGSTPVNTLYQGATKLWPSDGAYAMGLRIEQPQKGTIDYLYWLHAKEAIEGVDAGTNSCYLRFEINGTYYYIGASPDDSPALQMKGDVIQLTSGVKNLLADYVGGILSFEAVVPSRNGPNYKSAISEQGFSRIVLEPWLPGTYLTYVHTKGRKRVCSEANGSLTGTNTGKVYINMPWHNHPGHWRGTSRHVCYEEPNLEPDYSAEPLRINMEVGGNSTVTECFLTYPAFKHVFNLTVKEVY